MEPSEFIGLRRAELEKILDESGFFTSPMPLSVLKELVPKSIVKYMKQNYIEVSRIHKKLLKIHVIPIAYGKMYSCTYMNSRTNIKIFNATRISRNYIASKLITSNHEIERALGWRGKDGSGRDFYAWNYYKNDTP